MLGVLVLLLPVARAFIFQTPLQLSTCEPVYLHWSQGVAPYYLYVAYGEVVLTSRFVFPGDAALGHSLDWFYVGDDSYFTWTPDIGPGSPITLAVKDATSEMEYSGVITMEAGWSQDCVKLLGPAEDPSFWSTATVAYNAGPTNTTTTTTTTAAASFLPAPTSADPPTEAPSPPVDPNTTPPTMPSTAATDVHALGIVGLSSSQRTSLIAGATAGGAVGLAIILILLVCLCRQRKSAQDSKHPTRSPEAPLDMGEVESISSATKVTPFPTSPFAHEDDDNAASDDGGSLSEPFDYSSPPPSPLPGTLPNPTPFGIITPVPPSRRLSRSSSRGSLSSRSEKQQHLRPPSLGPTRHSRASSISAYSIYSLGSTLSDDGMASYNLQHDPARPVTRPEPAAGLAPISENGMAYERDMGRVINVLPPPYQPNWQDNQPREVHATDSQYGFAL